MFTVFVLVRVGLFLGHQQRGGGCCGSSSSEELWRSSSETWGVETAGGALCVYGVITRARSWPFGSRL